MKHVKLNQPKPIDDTTATFARKLMQNMQSKIDPNEVNRQAMMIKHFNQQPGGTSTFSHHSLGTKFRRYGTR
jgi:hypothetical protein